MICCLSLVCFGVITGSKLEAHLNFPLCMCLYIILVCLFPILSVFLVGFGVLYFFQTCESNTCVDYFLITSKSVVEFQYCKQGRFCVVCCFVVGFFLCSWVDFIFFFFIF